MPRFLLVPVNTETGLNAVVFGLMRAFEQNGNKPLFFKPVSAQLHGEEPALHMAEALFQQIPPLPVTLAQYDEAVASGHEDDVIEHMVADLDQLTQKPHDVVVIEGVAPSARTYLAAQNVKIAAALNADVILVLDVEKQDADTVAKQLQLALRDYAHSQTYIAGVVLNHYRGGAAPEQYLEQLRSALADRGLKLDCIGLLNATEEFAGSGAAADTLQMQQAVQAVADHLDHAWLKRSLERQPSARLSPAAFRYQMMARARAANKRIVLPEGNEPRTIAAAAICQSKGIAQCLLLAKPAEVEAIAREKGINLPEGLQIVDPADISERYVEPMVALRRHKGLTPEMAAEQLKDTVVLGTMMLATGEVDGLVSGAVHTTANTIRPALQLIKTAPGASLVSSVFFMLMPDQVLVYGDCAVNPDPSAQELADIAIQSADSAKAFGIEPKVAMISYSTGSSGSGPAVEKVKEATALAQAKRPDLLIDGPLQYDAASVPSVGRQKAPDSPVAGQATVFVFPDLNTGNTTYKAVQRSAHVLSVGPMLQGLNKPVNDLSRGALIDDIVYTIALTAIQATQMGTH